VTPGHRQDIDPVCRQHALLSRPLGEPAMLCRALRSSAAPLIAPVVDAASARCQGIALRGGLCHLGAWRRAASSSTDQALEIPGGRVPYTHRCVRGGHGHWHAVDARGCQP
jgi:hypothetical protein